jgi:hypothetical protein
MYRQALAFCILCSLVPAGAIGATIGVAVADGSFSIDGHPVVGNATLFDGSRVETGAAVPELRLNGGARTRLLANSRGQVYQNRLVLEKGMGEIEGGSAYRLEAQGLRLVAAGRGSTGRLLVSGSRTVQAAALSGSVRVAKADGTLVALLQPGKALEFQQQANAPAAVFEMTGCLERRDGRFILRDTLTGVVEELRGENLDGEVGRMVRVTASAVAGAKAVEGAVEVIQVSRIRRIGASCVSEPAGPMEQAPKSGTSSKSIIAGVAVAGAGAGAAVYLVTKKESSQETISR